MRLVGDRGKVINYLLLTYALRVSTRMGACGCHMGFHSGTRAACTLSGPSTCLSRHTLRHHVGRKLPISSASVPIYQDCVSVLIKGKTRLMSGDG